MMTTFSFSLRGGVVEGGRHRWQVFPWAHAPSSHDEDSAFDVSRRPHEPPFMLCCIWLCKPDGNPCCTTNCLLQLAKPYPDFVYVTRSRTRTRGIPLMLQIHRGGMTFLSSWRSERDTVMRPLLLLPSLPRPGSTRRISITPACSGAPNSHQLRHMSTRFSRILTTLDHSGTGSRSSDADFQTASRRTYAHTNTKL